MDERSPAQEAAKSLSLVAAAGALDAIAAGTGRLFEALVLPVATARAVEWQNSVDRRLRQLDEEVRRLGHQLHIHQDQLVDTYMLAQRAVVSSSDPLLMTALQNAVLNVALDPPPPEETGLAMSLIGRLTGLHLRVLRFVSRPHAEIVAMGRVAKWGPSFQGNMRYVLREHFPGFDNERVSYVVRDLHSMGLLGEGDLGNIGVHGSDFRGGAPEPKVERGVTRFGELILRLTDNPQASRAAGA